MSSKLTKQDMIDRLLNITKMVNKDKHSPHQIQKALENLTKEM